MNKEKAKWAKSHWLNSRGGRDWSDLLEDENGEYVLMGKDKKVYLPTIDKIISDLKLKLKVK